MMLWWVFLCMSAVDEVVVPVVPPTSSVTEQAPGHWSFAAVPRITINADEGAGLGLRGQALWHRFGTRPYKTAIIAQVWLTTLLVQHHFVRVDAIDAFNLPLRIEGELGFFASKSFTYCGDDDPCPNDASHRLRSIEPYASASARFRLWRAAGGTTTHKLEVFGGLRGTGYQPGTLFDEDGDGGPDLFPTPGSAYARAFPQGEAGVIVVPQVGIAYDGRNDEINPSRGAFVDVSVRGASSLWQQALGTNWSFAAATLVARLYAPLTSSDRVVVAQRAMLDITAGDAPTRERMRVGGIVDNTLALGGLDYTRGVRLARFVSPLRVSHQTEIRADVLHVDIWGHDLAWIMAVFLDVGLATDGVSTSLMSGIGVSTRLIWDKNFPMRLDIGLSSMEPGRISAYSSPGHTF
jgi:hypothetical protein